MTTDMVAGTWELWLGDIEGEHPDDVLILDWSGSAQATTEDDAYSYELGPDRLTIEFGEDSRLIFTLNLATRAQSGVLQTGTGEDEMSDCARLVRSRDDQ